MNFLLVVSDSLAYIPCPQNHNMFMNNIVFFNYVNKCILICLYFTNISS